MKDQGETNETTLHYLRELAARKFWGSVTLKFEAGRVVHIKKEESVKPDELSESPRLCPASAGKGVIRR